MTAKTATNESEAGRKTGLKLAVIGAGAWGTALALHASRIGHRVRLWAYEPQVVEDINQARENRLFLADVPLTGDLTATNDLKHALEEADMALLVMPSHVFRTVLSQAAPHIPEKTILISCAKGIEQDSGYTMCDVAQDVLPKVYHRGLCCLSGPSFAKEVAAGSPSAVTVACRKTEIARLAQERLSSPVFRVYTSPDLVGVELGGAVKNPLAIAAGMLAGLGLGHNTVAALITRGLAEMTRLSQARGGQLATLSGLAGLGDLVLTCTGSLSRNRTVGLRLGQGETIQQITESMQTVAEGVHNTKTIMDLARSLEVDMPIVSAVHDVIYGGKTPAQVLKELMTRDLKPEHY